VPAPPTPFFIVDDIPGNVQKIIVYLYSLEDYLNENVTDDAWVVTGVTVDKTLASGDTLTATQNVLGTLITTLKEKGIL
jgi:hypothetical protein